MKKTLFLLAGLAAVALMADTKKIDFTSKATAKEIQLPAEWKIEKGVMTSRDHTKGGLTSFKFNFWMTDYEFSFQIRCLGKNPKDQHFGFWIAPTATLYSRGNAFCYMAPKINTGFGKAFKPEMKAEKNAPWTTIKLVRKGKNFQVFKDGQLFGSREIPTGAVQFGGYAYGNYMQFKDFVITYTPAAAPVKK